MNPQRLYVTRQPLPEPLTIGLLRGHIRPEATQWISLEPRAWLPERDGRRISGRLPGLAPLAATLPDGLDDLPLLCASLYGEDRWMHFYDTHPLSQLPGNLIIWSLQPSDGAQRIDDLQCRQQAVLTWRDRERFGLPADDALPESLVVEHYFQGGRLIAWRLIPSCTEVCA